MKRPHSEISCDSQCTSETYDLDTGLPRSQAAQAAQASACSIFEYEPHASPIRKYSSGVEATSPYPSLFSAGERAAEHEGEEEREARSLSQQTPDSRPDWNLSDILKPVN